MKKLSFQCKLFRHPGAGGWTFATVPPECAPPYKLSWGRTPARAGLDGKEWDTSVWTERSGRILLPIPAKVRGKRKAGELVKLTLSYDR
ncbi:MAG: DUF1905 domain-containing protein [Leptospirales bacterium]|nr:DUF1905 domain-containing protein [Leptospirales bacterium]